MFSALLGRKKDAGSGAPDTQAHEARLVRALEKLEGASRVSKPLQQGPVFDAALRLIRVPGGIDVLNRYADRYAEAGAFRGSDWDHPSALQPRLARGSLFGEPRLVATEVLSELRMLAIAEGRVTDETMPPEDARDFLAQILAFNTDLLFDRVTEAERTRDTALREGVKELIGVISSSLSPDTVVSTLIDEIDAILRQRPVQVLDVKAHVGRLAGILAEGTELSDVTATRARRLVAALFEPSPLSKGDPGIPAYRAKLEAASPDEIRQEARACAQAMHGSALVSDYHAELVRFVDVAHPRLTGDALGLSDVGRQSLLCYRDLVSALISEGLTFTTAQAVFGLWSLLERGTLFHPAVAPGLWRQIRLTLRPDVRDHLALVFGPADDPARILLAGTVMVLGHPLGVGQGNNPTCQSARAIALFAEVVPDYLLQLICWAARDGEIVMPFEGDHISSAGLAAGLAPVLDGTLDAVSLVVVPHLDRIYAEMGRRVAGRGEDGHKWINPGFHGWWVPRGCRVLVDIASGGISDFDGFQRDFYASYHPFYNGNQPVIHPQPAGIAATNTRGVFVGWHAISIQRVALDPSGEMRVYFHDPNNEGRQQWGHDMHTSTERNGEFPGESSLLFTEFASRVYLFHYDPLEEGDPAAVPADEIATVAEMARTSWAADRAWI